jgi:hypothetical protein
LEKHISKSVKKRDVNRNVNNIIERERNSSKKRTFLHLFWIKKSFKRKGFKKKKINKYEKINK